MRIFVNFNIKKECSHEDLILRLTAGIKQSDRADLECIHWDTLSIVAAHGSQPPPRLIETSISGHQFMAAGWVHTDISPARLRRQFFGLVQLPAFRVMPIAEPTQILLADSVSTPTRVLGSSMPAPSAAGTIKMIAMIQRHRDLQKTHFRDRYEAIHVPLTLEHRRAHLCGYRRNYLIDSVPALKGDIPDPGDASRIDVLTEYWFTDEAALSGMQSKSRALKAAFDKDERKLFETSTVRMFSAKEYMLDSH
jgi:hypothetical protein